jgi:hypothetical protein
MTFTRKKLAVYSAAAICAVGMSTVAIAVTSAPAGAAAGPTQVCQAAGAVGASLSPDGYVETSFTFPTEPYVLNYGWNDTDNSDSWPSYIVATGQELAANKVYTFTTNLGPLATGVHGSADVTYTCS